MPTTVSYPCCFFPSRSFRESPLLSFCFAWIPFYVEIPLVIVSLSHNGFVNPPWIPSLCSPCFSGTADHGEQCVQSGGGGGVGDLKDGVKGGRSRGAISKWPVSACPAE